MKRVLLAAASFVWHAVGMAQTGTLDPTFGTDGIFTFAPGTLHDVAYGMAVLPDDKLVFCGSGRITATSGFTSDCVVGRLTADGAIDPTFGTDGTFVLGSTGGSVFGYDIKVQPDGKIVVCGGYSLTPSDTEFMVVRLMPDGTLDLSFGGGDGLVLLPLGDGEDYAYDVELLENGNILLAGTSSLSGGMYDQGVVVRLLPDGTLDATFGTNGSTTVQLTATTSDNFRSMVVLPSGRIVAAGHSYFDFAESLLLAAFTPDGALDPGFADGGIHSGTSINEAFDLVASADRLYIGGRISTDGYDAAIACFDHSGVLQTEFGTGGMVSANYNPLDFILGMHLQEDGKLLCVGATGLGTFNNRDVLISRYLPTGELDDTFAQTGTNIVAVSTSFEDGSTVLQQSDGRIVVAGFASFTTNDMLFLRLLNESTAAVESPLQAPDLALYPVPLSGNTLHIALSEAIDGPVVCSMHDAAGRLIASERLAAAASPISFALPADLPAGSYVFTLDARNSRCTRMVIK
jgi:uncharacterized delta-60 repeat protein